MGAEHARPAKIAALMLLGLGVGFFLTFAAAGLAGGDIASGQVGVNDDGAEWGP